MCASTAPLWFAAPAADPELPSEFIPSPHFPYSPQGPLGFPLFRCTKCKYSAEPWPFIGQSSCHMRPICFPFVAALCPAGKMGQNGQFVKRLIAFNSDAYGRQLSTCHAEHENLALCNPLIDRDRSNPSSKACIPAEKSFFSGICARLLHGFPSFIAQDLDGQQLCRCTGRQKRCAHRYAHSYDGDPQPIEHAGVEGHVRNGVHLRIEWNQMVRARDPGKGISDT